MRTATRLGAFGVGVVAVFGLAAAAGSQLGPIDVGASAGHATMPDHAAADAVPTLSGLSVAANGYRLVSEVQSIDADEPSSYTFRIERIDGTPLTELDMLHERRLHLIVLSRDLIDYLHLHPSMDDTGLWRVDLPALSAGSYRVYADFQPTGAIRLTLGTDLQVPGIVPTVALPSVSTTDEIDGYEVTLSGVPVVGSNTITLNVTRDGQSIATDPYLGAAGHLVVIRTGDLGYLHVHPMDGTDDTIRFDADLPTPGTYRLFFDFAHGGRIHTASFTVNVPSPPAADPTVTETAPNPEGP